MRLKINDIINKYKGTDKNCIIVGSGPTMNKFDYKNFNGKIIFCGSAILRLPRVNPDYLVSCNNHFPVINIKSHLNYLNKYKNTTWLFSDTGCYNDIWKYDEKLFDKLLIDHINYDDRHFGYKKCVPEKRCCKFLNMYKNRKTLLEILENQKNEKFPFKEKRGITVAEHALIFAILMGFSKIYIQGVDLPIKNYRAKAISEKYTGYENKKADELLDETLKIIRRKYFVYYLKNFSFYPYFISLKRRLKIFFNKKHSDFEENLNISLNIFQWLAHIAKKDNQKVYNLSPNSNLRKIKDIDFISSIEDPRPSPK